MPSTSQLREQSTVGPLSPQAQPRLCFRTSSRCVSRRCGRVGGRTRGYGCLSNLEKSAVSSYHQPSVRVRVQSRRHTRIIFANAPAMPAMSRDVCAVAHVRRDIRRVKHVRSLRCFVQHAPLTTHTRTNAHVRAQYSTRQSV